MPRGVGLQAKRRTPRVQQTVTSGRVQDAPAHVTPGASPAEGSEGDQPKAPVSLSPDAGPAFEDPLASGARGKMTKAELVDELARSSELTRKHSEVIVDAVFDSIMEALQKGDKIELRGFGSFKVRQRGSREGRNPKTGQGVVVPARSFPHFKPGKELRELINRR